MRKLVIIILLLSAVFAASNTTISFQGKLLDNTGAAITATKAMTYTLYTASTGGSTIGSAISLPSVIVNNGVYSVELDVSSVTLPDDVWVAVSVGGETLSPRIHLTSSAFAQKSATANFAVTANQLSSGVFVSSNGNVGIGTITPSVKLDVAGTVNATNYLMSSMGGAPIIASGSNPNGNYIKYADGTMIQWGIKLNYNVGNTAVYGSGTYLMVPISFPVNFVDLNYVVFATGRVTGRIILCDHANDTDTTSATNVFAFDPYNTTIYTMIFNKFDWQAIGRWK